MRIDTAHFKDRSVVKITLTAPERHLTDDQLARIANNQHRLRWLNGSSGEVELPLHIVGRAAPGARVERDGDHISVACYLRE